MDMTVHLKTVVTSIAARKKPRGPVSQEEPAGPCLAAFRAEVKNSYFGEWVMTAWFGMQTKHTH